MGRKKHQKKAASKENGEKPLEDGGNGSKTAPGAPEIHSDLFTCEISPIYGRYLRTKVDVKKGTLLLRENYLVAGPMRSSGPVCLGCNVSLADGKSSIPCPGCSWRLCSDKCAKSQFHLEECKFFEQHQIQPWPDKGSASSSLDYGAILVLRGLMLKLSNKKKWELLQTLEPHNEMRQKLPLWQENESTVVKPIREAFGLDKFFSVEEIHTVCGILEVNAFELGQDFSFRGVFPTAAMIAHDCIPNTTHFEDSVKGVIYLRAATDIPSGTPITICYAYASEGTIERRQMMEDTKFFHCICNRCSDPHELGTNLSTLKCTSCGNDELVNVKANQVGVSWQCGSCNALADPNQVSYLVAKYIGLSENAQGIKDREDLLRQCSKYFHPNHFIPFGLKFHLCQVYGREAVPLHDLSQEELERKLAICQEVMQVLDVVTPGMTVTRGLVLYELQASEIIISRRIFESRKFSRALLKRKLESTLKVLTEAVEILSLAHESTPEYTVAMSAKSETLPDLKRWINIVKKST